MNRIDLIAKLDRLLDGLETEILAASDADILGALADTGRVRTAVLHAARAAIGGEPGPGGPPDKQDTARRRLARPGIDRLPWQRGNG